MRTTSAAGLRTLIPLLPATLCAAAISCPIALGEQSAERGKPATTETSQPDGGQASRNDDRANQRVDEKLVLRNGRAQLSIALAGGGIVEFRFLDQPTNPLNWEIGELEPKREGKPYLRGHFLCLDRWGAPSEAEAKRGIPFHGEAPRVIWEVKSNERKDAAAVASMGSSLPLADLRVRRRVRLDASSPLVTVTERVENTHHRGRIYNMVQHPSIAPPFLDDSTLVDSNARQGFWQQALPDESTSTDDPSRAVWPKLVIDGKAVNLRRFQNDAGGSTRHDVSSFVFAEEAKYGWVTACHPGKRLLIGYLWRTSDYPWLNIWRYMSGGKVAARGLEFGTTGYHQPFARLVKQGRILDRPLYAHLDADQSVSRSYAMFLLRIPQDYRGVARLALENQQLTLTERGDKNTRTLRLSTGKLFED